MIASKSRLLLPVVAVLGALTIGVIGFLLGQNSNTKVNNTSLTAAETQQLLNAAYPKPPAEFFGFSGVVKEVNGNEVKLEINHPDDYLPTPDRRKQIRTVVVTEGTQIVAIDYNKVNRKGEFEKQALTIADIKANDPITVTSDSNIKYTERFDAKQIITSKAQ